MIKHMSFSTTPLSHFEVEAREGAHVSKESKKMLSTFTAANVSRIKKALGETLHEIPSGLTREERRAFILSVANKK